MTIIFFIGGVAVGYLFKPQIEKMVVNVIKYIRDKSDKKNPDGPE